jgi:4'-phosphopantetheinyl transferase
MDARMRHIDELPRTARPIVLDDDDVHVWYCSYEDVRDEALLARYDALMNEEERARHRRFYFERDRHMFLVTRALVRTVLSEYADCAPEDWTFALNPWGRPHISGPVAGPFFNLSNTHGLVACAVSRSQRIGVDVENTTRNTEPLAIADRFFSEAEVAALKALPDDQHRTRFFSLWTLKEAYIKARGMGLAIPLGQFSYDLDEAPISISFGDEITDDPTCWKFALMRASVDHFLSVAVDRPNARLTAGHVVPLA